MTPMIFSRFIATCRCAAAVAALIPFGCGFTAQAATVITANSGNAINFASPETPGNLGSNISLAAPGNSDFLTSPGATGTVGTPDIALTWSSRDASETRDWRQRAWNANNMSDGGALQIRGTSLGSAFTITFTPEQHTAVVINGFNFIGDRDNPGEPYQYRIDVVDVASGNVAKSVTTRQWETDVTQTPAATGTWAGAPAVDVSFTGEYGKAYRLELVRIAGPAPDAASRRSEVDMAIDNLSFDQLTGSLWSANEGDWDTGLNWNTGIVPASSDPVWIPYGNAVFTSVDQPFRRGSTTLIDGGALTLENSRLLLLGEMELRSGAFVQNNSTYFIARGADPNTGVAPNTRFLQTGGEVRLALSRGLFLSDSTVSDASGNLELRGGSFEATLTGSDTNLHQVHIGARGTNDRIYINGGALRITHNGPTDQRFVRIGRNGSFHLASGTAELLRFQKIVLGHDFGTTNGTASMVVDAGSLEIEVADSLAVGDRYPGRLEINGGRVAIRKVGGNGGNLQTSHASSSVAQSGGELVVEGDFLLGGDTPVEMSGGVLRAATLSKEGSGQATFTHSGGEIFLGGNQVAYLQAAEWFIAPPNAVFTFDATTNTTRVLPDYQSTIPTAGIPYQSYITDQNGIPLGMDPTGASAPVNIDFQFRILDAPTGGNLLHGEIQTLAVDRGAFGAILGSGAPVQGEPFAASLASVFPANGGEERYLETSWRPSPESGWAKVLPRVRMLGAPYSLHAASALKLLNPDGDELLQSSNGSLNLSGSLLSTATVTLSGFTGEAESLDEIDAGGITSGTFPAQRLSLTGGHFSKGEIPVASLPDLSSRIASVDASKFTTGLLDPARLPANTNAALADKANSFASVITVKTEATLGLNAGPLALNDHALQLRDASGTKGSAWLQYKNNFGGISGLDGPVLAAYRYGALGSRPGGKHRIALEWDSDQRVTIYGKLKIEGGTSNGLTALAKGRKFGRSGASFYSSKPSDLKVYAQKRIQAFAYGATSDERTKEVLASRDAAKDAALIKQLRVVDYSPPADSALRRKGFIAQEVREVLPDAVSLQPNLLPDIMAPAVLDPPVEEALLRLRLPSAHGLSVGEIVGIHDGDSVSEHQIVRVDSAECFLIQDPGSLPGKVMVIGRKVDDFHVLDYDRIFLSGLHVTQELLRASSAQSERLRALETRLDAHAGSSAQEVLAAAEAALQTFRGELANPAEGANATLPPVSSHSRR